MFTEVVLQVHICLLEFRFVFGRVGMSRRCMDVFCVSIHAYMSVFARVGVICAAVRCCTHLLRACAGSQKLKRNTCANMYIADHVRQNIVRVRICVVIKLSTGLVC